MTNSFDVPGRITIHEDRYRGTYSGGMWLAVVERWETGGAAFANSEAFGSDITCNEFWETSPAALRIGRGSNPTDALVDLKRIWVSDAEPRSFYWDEML